MTTNSNVQTPHAAVPTTAITKIVIPRLYVNVTGDIRWEITNCTMDLINTVRKQWDHSEGTNDKGEPYVEAHIPREWAKYRTKTRQVLTCALTASADYMKHHLGMDLDSDDTRWYTQNPSCVEQGLPKDATLTVLNNLVRPYGLGISQIFIKKGSALSEEAQRWVQYLGCNPLGLLDRSTSNEEYCKLVYGDLWETQLPQVNGEFGMQFTDKPIGSVILFTAFVKTSYAQGGGHASYVGPRGQVKDWEMAIKLNKLEHITYYEEPPITEYEATQQSELDVWSCLCKDGRSLVSHSFPQGQGTGFWQKQGHQQGQWQGQKKKSKGKTYDYNPVGFHYQYDYEDGGDWEEGDQVGGGAGSTNYKPEVRTSVISLAEFKECQTIFPDHLESNDFHRQEMRGPVDEAAISSLLGTMQGMVDKLGSTSEILAYANCKLQDLDKSQLADIKHLKSSLVSVAWESSLSMKDIIRFYTYLWEDRQYDILWALSGEVMESLFLCWAYNKAR